MITRALQSLGTHVGSIVSARLDSDHCTASESHADSAVNTGKGSSSALPTDRQQNSKDELRE
jgi:hypothetical protein